MNSKGARYMGSSMHAHGGQGRRSRVSSDVSTNAGATPIDGFLVLTISSIVYLLFVLTYNARLLETASVGAALVDLEFVENFGMVLAGVGLSLLAWRLQQRLLRGTRLWPLVAYLTLSAPLMWGLQEWATRSLVSAATPSQLRSTYIASLATDGLRNNRKLKDFEWLSDGQHDYDSKTFFALFPALASYDAALVAAVETKLSKLVRHTVELREGSADARFRDYENEEFRFHRIYSESYASPSQRATIPQQGMRSELEPAGRAADGTALPVIPASLPRGLSWQQFSKRDDVRESFARRMGYHAGQFLDFGMQRSEFTERVYEPMIRSREAEILRPLGVNAGFDVGSAARQRGIDTYRAAIEPAVGLAFSLFFALLNAVALVASIVFRSPPVVASAQ